MTYMVMEIHKSYSVVMDEGGRFLKVASMGYQIGDTVDFVYEMTAAKTGVSPLSVVKWAGGVAACLAVVITLYFYNILTPFASIYLTINPAVRMEVNQGGRVVGISPMNDDGAVLLEGYSWSRKNMDLVADELVDRAIEQGFLSSGGMVTVNIDSPDEAWFLDTGIALRQNLDHYLEERLEITVQVKQYTQPDPAPAPEEQTIPENQSPPEEQTAPEEPPAPQSQASRQETPPAQSQQPPAASSSQPEPSRVKQLITADAALGAALSHAGVARSQANVDKVKLDRDNDQPIYKVEFYAAGYEYEYKIDAYTGAVIKWEADEDDDYWDDYDNEDDDDNGHDDDDD